MIARSAGTTARTQSDVRLGQRWTRRQAWKNTVIALVVRASLALVAPLPRAWLRAFGRALAWVAFVVWPGARRTARANLARVFPAMNPERRRALLAETYATLGAHLGDAIASLEPTRALDALPIDDASLALLQRADRGVIFASAHLGPWERVAASLAARGVPLTAVARESYDPRLDRIYARLREARGVPVIYRGEPGAPMRLVRALRARRVLGIPMDLKTRAPSIESTFLSAPALTPVGPARIALRVGAAVVVGTVAPSAASADSPLQITCTAIETSDLEAGAHGERVLTDRINAELSARIRALPNHWPWMHERFERTVELRNSGRFFERREPNLVDSWDLGGIRDTRTPAHRAPRPGANPSAPPRAD